LYVAVEVAACPRFDAFRDEVRMVVAFALYLTAMMIDENRRSLTA